MTRRRTPVTPIRDDDRRLRPAGAARGRRRHARRRQQDPHSRGDRGADRRRAARLRRKPGAGGAAKWPALLARHPGCRLHCIGRLQSNKAAEAVALFDVIHSLDRASLLDALASGGAKGAAAPRRSTSRSTSARKSRRAAARSPRSARWSRRSARSPLPLAGLMAIPPLGRRAGALFRAAGEAGARPWRHRAQHGHVRRLSQRGDARRDRGAGRHRAVRRRLGEMPALARA